MTKNITLRELPWGVIVTVVFNIVGGIIFLTTVSVQQNNFKDFVALQFKNITEANEKALSSQKIYLEQKIDALDIKIGATNEKVIIQQNTLDQRGQYGAANNEKTIKMENRLENLERAVSTINDNIQTIVNRIWNEKKPRGVVN